MEPEHGSTLDRTVHSEKEIQVHVAPGVTVAGRIDLIRRLDTDELAIVDFKSTARAQDETSHATNSTCTPSATRSSPANGLT